jgi:hypothetical protein
MMCIISCSVSLDTTFQLMLSGLPVDLEFDFVFDLDLDFAFAAPGSRAFSICSRLGGFVSSGVDLGVANLGTYLTFPSQRSKTRLGILSASEGSLVFGRCAKALSLRRIGKHSLVKCWPKVK